MAKAIIVRLEGICTHPPICPIHDVARPLHTQQLQTHNATIGEKFTERMEEFDKALQNLLYGSNIPPFSCINSILADSNRQRLKQEVLAFARTLPNQWFSQDSLVPLIGALCYCLGPRVGFP